MRNLEIILAGINKSVERYELTKLHLTSDQSEILRDLSANLYFLVQHRIAAHERWMECYFESTEKSAAGKEREADRLVPELYTIRHFMSSGQKVLEAVRSTLSANK